MRIPEYINLNAKELKITYVRCPSYDDDKTTSDLEHNSSNLNLISTLK